MTRHEYAEAHGHDDDRDEPARCEAACEECEGAGETIVGPITGLTVDQPIGECPACHGSGICGGRLRMTYAGCDASSSGPEEPPSWTCEKCGEES